MKALNSPMLRGPIEAQDWPAPTRFPVPDPADAKAATEARERQDLARLPLWRRTRGASLAGGKVLAAPHESARIVARDLVPVVSELASLKVKGEVYRDLGSRTEHRALAHRLEAAHAAAEAALVEAWLQARLDGER